LFDYYTAYNQFKLIEHISKNKQCFTAIYHAPVQISMSDLRQLGRLAGYFYSDTPSRTIAQAVSNIAIGQRSLPPAISDQLLDYYQSAVVYYDVSYCTNLTRREIEVLKHLKQGGSNTKLADALFISEHTIKSHLYQIFKKIEVQSRSQAIAWAHKYLL
jgi:DNA-binding NarL/FixJ family response regulator